MEKCVWERGSGRECVGESVCERESVCARGRERSVYGREGEIDSVCE